MAMAMALDDREHCDNGRASKQEGLKSHGKLDKTSEDQNCTLNKSDSDKVLGTTAASTCSIYAKQRQRRRGAASIFERKLEERRKSMAVGLVQNVQANYASACCSGQSAVAHIGGNDQPQIPEGVPSLQVSDSGYITRNEAAVSNYGDEPAYPSKDRPIKDEPIKSQEKKAQVPLLVVQSEPVVPVSVISPSSQTDNYFLINLHQYRILNQIGAGGSSRVYQVYDEERKLCLAVKRVDLADADDLVVTAYRNEIALLKRLQKYPNRVVRMYDYEYVATEQRLYVVMEKGDTDLASLFKSRQKDKLPDQMIAFYWLEMLKAVQIIHQEGIVHSDLKPANFLLVAGNLKLIDFGIANAVPSNKTSVTRECQMGTLNYISPEAVCCTESLDDAKNRVSVKSDVWSLGCILYNMVYGKTPLQDIRNPMSKVATLLNRNHQITFPPVCDSNVVDVMKRCLERDPKRRANIDELLEHPYVKRYNGCEGASEGVDDDGLRVLAATISKSSPRTGARLIKAALGQMKGTSQEHPTFNRRQK